MKIVVTRPPVRSACRMYLRQPVHQQRSVGQFGQRVMQRHEMDLFLGALAVGDVAADADDADDLVLVVAQGDLRGRQPLPVAGDGDDELLDVDERLRPT